MGNGTRRKRFAIFLMFGVIILVSASASSESRGSAAMRRFLAVDNASGRSLFTVVADATTAVRHPDLLTAGHQVRVVGIRTGRTIRARRIEIVD